MELQVEHVRDLTLEDLALDGPAAYKQDVVKTIRDSHHSVARLLAEGLRDGEISSITGYTGARIGQLKASPAFRELVEFYRQNLNVAQAQFSERLTAMAFDAQQELQRRLDETPEEFSVQNLKDLVTAGADRIGFGPKTTTVNLNVELSTRMETARRRVLEGKPT